MKGDYNNDGYPDILILTQNSGKNSIQILESIRDTNHVHSRSFATLKKGMNELDSFPFDIVGGFFFDVDDDVFAF